MVAGVAMRPKPCEVDFYEGLVRKTAARYASRIQEDYEDIASILRVKVWRALLAYDPARSSLPVERYVFSCVANQVKDLLKRKRRNEVYIADMVTTTVDGDELRDSFEQDHLSVDHDVVYADVEREPPVIPSTLSRLERRVVVALYLDANQRKAAAELGLTRSEMEGAVESIRTKMADWRPTTETAVERQLAA